uniref:Acetyl-CoA carboxylase n=1 Tax=Ditylenchus dipsaci TaxID=166011 RepID=A0A915CZJ9_9BILA
MPRVYVSVNSGARIGFAMDVKKKLNVVWNDNQRPEDGFQCLTVDCEGPDDSVLQQIEYTKAEDGRYRIDAIIGKENDLGVENLVGSGLIAGETSAAYKEVPIYCLVTGRAVGIGAYAARLSHRICQVESSHIILTGAPALNTVLGKEVYTSNSQLGGPQIMHRNGVSHAVAQTDLDGVSTIIKWISYLPPPPTSASRLVDTLPTKSAYDPRLVMDPPEGGGLFDRNTFDEIMAGWAKTIIAGRARLRGIPVGVVAVETRTVENEIPADPAAQDSQSMIQLQAGQVWYPDSSYKSAEAINDFNREGLPLVILANVRGFSGGQKDMFEMVLKFGASIVDALQAYTQPVIVYLPPFGELRGGAWAVLDTNINPTCITMLADPDSRVVFWNQLAWSDEKLKKLEAIANDKQADKVQRDKATAEIAERKEFLNPIYKTAAVKFGDLHDTTARMLAKGAIHDEVTWQNSRNYMYRLFSVELAKMSMARQYLCAIGHQPDKICIEDLNIGYKWVEQHLAEAKVNTRRMLRHNPRNYAESQSFKAIIEQIDLERSKKALTSILEKEDSTKESVMGEILANSTSTVRESFLLQQLKQLSLSDRQNYLVH